MLLCESFPSQETTSKIVIKKKPKNKPEAVLNIQRVSGREEQKQFTNSYTMLFGLRQKKFSGELFSNLISY